jgi:hypothetical protein
MKMKSTIDRLSVTRVTTPPRRLLDELTLEERFGTSSVDERPDVTSETRPG